MADTTQHQYSILWADDEIDLLKPHLLFLERKGYGVTTAMSGRDALDMCATRHFDLIILDENMPGLTGLETLAAIKQSQPHIPVIMITKSEEENIMNHFSNNNQSNIPKVYFIPNSRKGLGIDSMGELAVSFELSGQFVNEAGISVPYIHIAHALEQAFNFTFGNVHKSKGRVFKRKPFNLTKALDYLKNLVIRENRNRVANKDEKR